MTEPTPLPRSVTEVAQESAEESTNAEREAVGNQPDEGGLVDQDDSQ